MSDLYTSGDGSVKPSARLNIESCTELTENVDLRICNANTLTSNYRIPLLTGLEVSGITGRCIALFKGELLDFSPNIADIGDPKRDRSGALGSAILKDFEKK